MKRKGMASFADAGVQIARCHAGVKWKHILDTNLAEIEPGHGIVSHYSSGLASRIHDINEAFWLLCDEKDADRKLQPTTTLLERGVGTFP